MAGKRYEKDELQQIAIMRDRGLSIAAIAKEVGRTPSGVQGALRARGWIDSARSQVMSSVRTFSPDQREAFREFICSRAARQTPTDIRDEWNREAATNGWPIVNSERVIYWLRGFGLQRSKRDYMQFESYRLKQSVAQKARRAKEQKARRLVLRTLRGEVYARQPDLPRRKCQVCSETWPLTEEFFRNAGAGPGYFLNTCRMCYGSLNGTASDRRRRRMDAYDRHVIVKQISVAKAERDSFLRQHRTFPTRRCSRCHENWELLSTRYPMYDRSSGGKLYRRTCRFCLRAAARFKERAESVLDRIPAMKDCDPNAQRIVETDSHVPLFAR